MRTHPTPSPHKFVPFGACGAFASPPRRQAGWPQAAGTTLSLAALLLLGGCALGPGMGPGLGGSGSDPVAEARCRTAGDGQGVVVGSGVPGDPALPEPSSGYRLGKRPAWGAHFMVVSANPLATQAGCLVLAQGGSAADAAVAVQMVLGLTEPQSSGIGGGAFVLHYHAASQRVTAYDGRETAPGAADENYLRHIGPQDTRAPQPSARASGRSIGTPGTVRVLELLHQDHGQRPWASLFQPGIGHAVRGFVVSGRLADAIAGARGQLLQDPDAVAYFLNPDLSPRTLGSRLHNPAYAQTLRAIAAGGSAAFYGGPVAADLVAEIQRNEGGPQAPGPITPGLTTLGDLSGYRALRREPVCSDYRAYRVCGMGPPSSGGVAVAQILGTLGHFDLPALGPLAVDGEGGRPDVMAVHLVSEAQRLAYADRNRYLADTDFVALPGAGLASLLDPNYLRGRAELIRRDASMGMAKPGVFAPVRAQGSSAHEGKGTSQVSIVDSAGNAVSMTTTIEGGMGAYRFVRGFLLNNELTDFSPVPADAEGPIANRVQPLKRPRSSMAPTLVFERQADGSQGPLLMVTGSPGGAAIIQFVTKTLLATLDWGLDAQQSAGLVNFGAGNSPTTGIGGEHPLFLTGAGPAQSDPLPTGLRALGHQVSLNAQSSGVSTVLRASKGGVPGWQGGADPRREGLALGD